MDSVTIRSSFKKDLKRRSRNYRPRRKTSSVIARKPWPSSFGILILRAGQHEIDRDANPPGCSWFETPAAESGNGGVIQNGITDALLHHGIHGQPTVGIHSDHGDAAPGNMAAARFVWVIRPRRVKHERLSISLCRYPYLPGWPNGSGGLLRFDHATSFLRFNKIGCRNRSGRRDGIIRIWRSRRSISEVNSDDRRICRSW